MNKCVAVLLLSALVPSISSANLICSNDKNDQIEFSQNPFEGSTTGPIEAKLEVNSFKNTKVESKLTLEKVTMQKPHYHIGFGHPDEPEYDTYEVFHGKNDLIEIMIEAGQSNRLLSAMIGNSKIYFNNCHF